MDLNFYCELSDGSGQNVDSEFLDTQGYSGYSENKFPGGSDNYLITGGGHPFLSAEHTFHTPSLGDEVFEIPPISLDPDSALTVGDVVSHFGELSEGSGGQSGSRGLVNNPVVGANDPSFASTYVTSGSQGLEHLSLGVMSQAGGGALLSSSALELSNSMGSHFSSSSPMTIDVPLGDINHGLLGSGQLSTIDQSELGLGLGGGNILSRSKSPDQPLSATPSPAGSLQDEDMDDFRKSVLVDSPMSFSSPSVLSHVSSLSGPPSSISLATVRRGGGKPAQVAPVTTGAKRGRKKKDPNEPQKPVSAYALFFKDTQAAIKGQNPNATFGEVSKIVASMWDSLGEDQKQVYKRKTEAAKKDYLKALAAYRANQLCQPSHKVMDTAPSPPPPPVAMPPAAAPPPAVMAQSRLPQYNPEENTITNICASNIILDVPEVTTRSRSGANKPTPAPPPAPTITKIIISKQMLQGGGQVVTVLPGGLRTLQPAAASRQPPPLQQMQHAPPRLQQMAPPPLQAKPREGGAAPGLAVTVAATSPPPLQIKIVPATLQGGAAMPIIVTTAVNANSIGVPMSVHSSSMAVQVVSSTELSGSVEEEVVPEEVEMELSLPPPRAPLRAPAASHSVCVRSGCTNPAVESDDWDKEYCSNECVARHCKDIFMAWCSIRSHNMATVK